MSGIPPSSNPPTTIAGLAGAGQTGVPLSSILQALQALTQSTNAQAQVFKGNNGKAAAGDLSGQYPDIIVISTHLASPLPLTQGGTANTTGQPSGAAAGDLSGTYPKPTVAQINGKPLGDTTPSAGNILVGSGTDWASVPVSGDATLDATGKLTVTSGGGGTLGPYATASLGDLPGVANAHQAPDGDIGEEIESIVAAGSAVALTTGTPISVTSMVLTPGNWDVWGYIGFTGAGSTTVQYLYGSISLANNTIDQSRSRWASQVPAGGAVFGIAAQQQFACGQDRYFLGGNTPIYLVAQAGFGTSTCSAFGAILARRRL